MKRLFCALLCALFSMTSLAHAHSLWVNNVYSDAHLPGHAMVSIGWGHTMPMDDIPNSPNGKIILERFQIIDPDMKRVDLKTPSIEECKPFLKTPNFDVFPGDLAVQKVALKKETKPGVYQLNVVSKPMFYTQYVDKKGRQRLKLKPKNEIKDSKKVLMSVKYQAYAKSFITVGKWSRPTSLGHGLEIIPMTDLSNVRVGDLVQVEVHFYGKPLDSNAKSINYITAQSPGFGQSERYSLFSHVKKGKAQFRVKNTGQWMISANHKGDVTKDGPLKDLYGKAEQVYHSASLTFSVK